MKRFKYFFLFIFLVITQFSCKEEESVVLEKEFGELQLGFTEKILSNQRIKEASATHLLITVQDENEESVFEKKKVEIYRFNNELISEPISLEVGNYQLTEFFILNSAGEIIYATPKKEATLDYMVQLPLPMAFSIQKDMAEKLSPEVLKVENVAASDFGYATFSLQVVKSFDFLVGVFTYKAEISNFVLNSANLLITTDSEDTVYNSALENKTSIVKVRDGYQNYKLLFDKDGYKPVELNFTTEELKFHISDPLEVVLFHNLNPTNGLLAHFPLNANANNLVGDIIEGNIEGALASTDRFSTSDKAFTFDGKDDRISFGDVLDFGSSDFTVSFWVNVSQFTGLIPNTNTRGAWVVSKGITKYGTPSRAGYGINALRSESKNVFQFFLGNQNDQSFKVEHEGFQENTWYHLTVVRSGLEQKLYANGLLVATNALPSQFNIDTNIPLVFGSIEKLGNDAEGTSYFNGKLDDVRFYNRALSDDEISYLYHF